MSLEDRILSEFLDDEVPAPWNARVAERIDSDPQVRAALERLKTTQQLMRTSAASIEKNLDLRAAQERVWARLLHSTAEVQKRSPFERRVSLPVLSVAAAAVVVVASAVVAILAMNQLFAPAYAVAEGRLPVGSLREQPAAIGHRGLPVAANNGITGDIEVTIAVQDIDQLLQILGARSGIREVRIELPQQAQFQLIGEPLLLKASDFSRESGR